MKEKEILKNQSKYLDYIIKLSEFPLSKNPTLEELGITHAVLQSCYRDIKELNFYGNIVDYLCFVSTKFILLDWERMFGGNYSGEPGDWLLDVCKRYKENAKNMVRLFCKDTTYVLTSDPAKNADIKEIYLTVNEIRWQIITSKNK